MGAAEQQQFTQYPHRYGDGTLGAAIAQTRDGKDELVTPVALWELDDTSGLYLPPGLSQNPRRPRVDAQLSGRNVQPEVSVLRDTPLAAGQSVSTASVDLTATPGVLAVGLAVYADQPTTVAFVPMGGVDENTGVAEVTFAPGETFFIPPFRPVGSSYRWHVTNHGTVDQTVCNIVEYRYRTVMPAPQNLRGLLAYNVEIRDIAPHSGFDNSGGMYRLRRTLWGGGKVPVFVRNQLDQAVEVRVIQAIANAMSVVLGSLQVPAGGAVVITNQDFAGIDVPSEELFLHLQCTAAPTTGSVSAWVDTLVGGSA